MQRTLHFFTSRAALIALGIAAASVLAWVWVRVRNQEKQNSMAVVSAIPADAVFALRINAPSRLCSKMNEHSPIFALLDKSPNTQELTRALQWTADTFARQSPACAEFMRQTWWISAHIFDSNIRYLFAAEIPSHLYLKDVQQMIDLLAGKGFASVSLDYDGEKITTFRRGSEEVFHTAVVRRVLMASGSRILVENAIRGSRVAASLADVPHFNAAAAAAGANVDVNLYVQSAALPKLLGLYLRPPCLRSAGALTHLGSFWVLDATLKPSHILLNGFLFNHDKKNSYFNALQSQTPRPLTIPDLLPRSTDGVYAFALNNVKKFVADHEEYHSINKNETYLKRIEKLEQQIQGSPAQFFADLYPAGMALAHVPLTGTDKSEQWFIVLKSGSIDAAKKAMDTRLAARKGKGKPEQKLTLANNSQITIYENPAQGLVETLAGDMFAACADKYVWYYGDYLVFAASPASLGEFALAAMSKYTLSQSVNLHNYTSAESNVFIYLNPKRPNAHYLDVLKPQARNHIQSSPLFAATEAMGAQMRIVNDSEVYCNVFYSAQGAGDSEGQPPKLPFIFETKLNAPLRQPPSVLKNHHTLANNLLAQDINNVIYLIDHQGGILWQRSIGEAMMGAAQQIDLLKNNKLQIVFNTRSKIYVIDRLGNDVPPYPAALPAPATAPMAVFDYDRTRSYRFFVPCIGGKIYACEAGGKPLKGFDPPALGLVTQPLMHVRRAGRDFIIVTDNRRVHILDRRGEVRLPTADIFPAPQTLAWCEYNANGSAARLAITTAKGELLSLSLDNGVAEKIPIDQKLSEHHHFAVSRQGDYIFLNGRELSVFAPNLKSKLDVSVKQPPAAPPLCFVFGGEQFYSVYSAHENKAYLWDGEGRLLPAFPLPAAAPAILVQLSKTTPYQIVVGDPNGYLSCYGIHRQED